MFYFGKKNSEGKKLNGVFNASYVKYIHIKFTNISYNTSK